MYIRIHMVEIALQESLEVIGLIQRPRESTSFTPLDLETKNYTKILKNKKVRVFYFFTDFFPEFFKPFLGYLRSDNDM